MNKILLSTLILCSVILANAQGPVLVNWSTNYVAVITTNTTTIVPEETKGYRAFVEVTLVNSNNFLIGPGGQTPVINVTPSTPTFSKTVLNNGSISAKTVSGVSTATVYYGRGDLIK